MLKLKEILAKEPANLSDEEKAFLKDHASELSAEDKSKFASVLEDEGTLNEDEVKALIAAKAQEVLAEKMDEMSDQLVAKFFDGVAAQRKKAIDTGKPAVDPNRNTTREFMKALMTGDASKIKALTTADDDTPKAGYLIPTELQNEILRVAAGQYGVARAEMRYLPFSGAGNTRQIPTLGTSVSVSWTDEKAKKPGTQPTFGLVNQTLKKLTAIVPMTEEILEDSAINLTQLIAELFAEAIAKAEDEAFFAGTGSPWTGVLNNGSVNVVNMGTGEGFSALTADDLLDMIDKTPSGALNGSKFYMNRTILSVVRKLKAATTGEYIYQNPGGGLPATIWNYPVVTCDAFPGISATAAAKAFVLFGNLKQAAVFGDKQQMRMKILDQATITDTDGTTPINLAEQDAIGIRVVERVGYVLALPSAVTVLKSGAAS
jgi:HK97 family phage major capsid protein